MIYTCFGHSFEEKHGFRKNYICFISLDCKCKKWYFVVGLRIFSGQWAKNLQFFGKKYSEASSKLHFRFGRQKLEEKNCFFLKKTQYFILFGRFGHKTSGYGWKVMVALLDLLRTCLANMSRVLDNLTISSQLSGFEQNEVGHLAENFPQDCRNYIIRVQKIILRKSLLYGRIIFPKLFLDQECKLFALLKFFSRQGFQTWMHIVQKNTWRKKFLGKKV